MQECPLQVTPTDRAGQLDLVPDINDIEPEDDMDVGSVGFPPSRPPGLARAGGLPQAAAAMLPRDAAGTLDGGAGGAAVPQGPQ
eukprot:11942783-Alexandrium_andersonii.AAC.1